MLEDLVKERLQKKLVDTVQHLAQVRADRKASNASFGEEIKGAQKRVDVLATTIKSGDLTLLPDAFFQAEIEDVLRGSHPHD